jgi:hypothetical protein
VVRWGATSKFRFAKFSVRFWVLLAALVVALMASWIVLQDANAPEGNPAKLSFTLSGYSSGGPKTATIGVTNSGRCAVTWWGWSIMVEGDRNHPKRITTPLPAVLEPGKGLVCSFRLPVATASGPVAPDLRWRVLVAAEPATTANSVRRTLSRVPVVCKLLRQEETMMLNSELFSQEPTTGTAR